MHSKEPGKFNMDLVEAFTSDEGLECAAEDVDGGKTLGASS